MKSSLVGQAVILAALALLPAAGEAIYFRDKISWRSAIAPSEMVTVEQARAYAAEGHRATAAVVSALDSLRT